MSNLMTMEEYIATLKHGDYKENVYPPRFRRIDNSLIEAFCEDFDADGLIKTRYCYLFDFDYSHDIRHRYDTSTDIRIRGSYVMAALQVLQNIFLEHVPHEDRSVLNTICTTRSHKCVGIYFRDWEGSLPIGKMISFIEALHIRAEINFNVSLILMERDKDSGNWHRKSDDDSIFHVCPPNWFERLLGLTFVEKLDYHLKRFHERCMCLNVNAALIEQIKIEEARK